MKRQASLLLCCDNEGGCIGREGGEARIGERGKMKDGACGVPRIEHHGILHKYDTEPLQKLEKLLQSNVSIEAGLAHPNFESSLLRFDPRK